METTITKPDYIFKRNYTSEEVEQMLFVQKATGVTFAFIKDKMAIDYFEFKDAEGKTIKHQVSVTNLEQLGLYSKEEIAEYAQNIPSNGGYSIAEISEYDECREKIEKLIKQLGA